MSHTTKLIPAGKSMSSTEHGYNQVRAELRQRAEEAGYEIGEDGLCTECDGKLTEADVEYGACTQCGAEIPALDERDDNEEE